MQILKSGIFSQTPGSELTQNNEITNISGIETISNPQQPKDLRDSVFLRLLS